MGGYRVTYKADEIPGVTFTEYVEVGQQVFPPDVWFKQYAKADARWNGKTIVSVEKVA